MPSKKLDKKFSRLSYTGIIYQKKGCFIKVANEVHKEMKKHPEIKWSEIARRSIIEKTILLKKSIHSKDLLNLLPHDTKKNIERAEEKSYAKFYKNMKRSEWKRKKYLTLV